jgi:hypothetical protein
VYEALLGAFRPRATERRLALGAVARCPIGWEPEGQQKHRTRPRTFDIQATSHCDFRIDLSPLFSPVSELSARDGDGHQSNTGAVKMLNTGGFKAVWILRGPHAAAAGSAESSQVEVENKRRPGAAYGLT